MKWPEREPQITPLNIPMFNNLPIEVSFLREDLLHSEISGNKWRKLKYNVLRAAQRSAALLTFGGPFSNHIAATAYATKAFGIPTIGLIRGLDADLSNPTLSKAKSCGMKLIPISRDDYRAKHEEWFHRDLRRDHGNVLIVPEGGANADGVHGCVEILGDHTRHFDEICVSMGTGTTFAGMAMAKQEHQHLHGFVALKGYEEMQHDVAHVLKWYTMDEASAQEALNGTFFHHVYHGGGFGKVSASLVAFMNQFYRESGVRLDALYTAKMVQGVLDLARNAKFRKNAKVLMVHTGGLQGNKGVEQRYGYQLD